MWDFWDIRDDQKNPSVSETSQKWMSEPDDFLSYAEAYNLKLLFTSIMFFNIFYKILAMKKASYWNISFMKQQLAPPKTNETSSERFYNENISCRIILSRTGQGHCGESLRIRAAPDSQLFSRHIPSRRSNVFTAPTLVAFWRPSTNQKSYKTWIQQGPPSHTQGSLWMR